MLYELVPFRSFEQDGGDALATARRIGDEEVQDADLRLRHIDAPGRDGVRGIIRVIDDTRPRDDARALRQEQLARRDAFGKPLAGWIVPPYPFDVELRARHIGARRLIDPGDRVQILGHRLPHRHRTRILASHLVLPTARTRREAHLRDPCAPR